MSAHSETCLVALRLEDVRRLCGEVMTAMSWHVVEEDTRQLLCTECARAIVPVPFRVTMTLRLEKVAPMLTRVALTGSNIGRGPAQEAHVRSRVRRVRDRIHGAGLGPARLGCRPGVVNQGEEV
jgi:hypothetical protein